jgi:hypothetical protein
MNSYILLLHESATLSKNISPEEMQAIIGRYKAWSQKLAEAGRLAGGNKLEDGTRRVLSGEGAQMRITDGPYAETKDAVGGYFVINAETYEEAVEWSKDCPHLAFGGSIELRKIDVV